MLFYYWLNVSFLHHKVYFNQNQFSNNVFSTKTRNSWFIIWHINPLTTKDDLVVFNLFY